MLESFILPTVLVPLAAATVVLLAARRGAAGGTAAALAFCAGYVALTGWPSRFPVEATQRLFFLVPIAAAVAWLPTGSVGRWLRPALAALWVAALLQSPIRHRFSQTESVLWVLGLTAAVLVLAALWDRAWTEDPDRIAAAVRIALLCSLAIVLGASGSARLAQLTGALTCGVGVVEVGSRVLGRDPWRRNEATVVVLAAGGLAVCGHLFAELRPVPGLLLATSFYAHGLLRGRGARHAVALLPALVAVGLAVAALMGQEPDPYAGY